MTGEPERPATMMLGLSLGGFIPMRHPMRRIESLGDSAMNRKSPKSDQFQTAGGHSSIPHEHLHKSSL
ncbi:MAG: hypothetical protein OXD50_09260 [Chloroflexi bacterium]|nr:hypothetical protein [Chloroflexota bacterium]